MKGVILAGGRGTRLMPLTKATNKHLLPVGREPMLYHPLRQMVNADIDEVLVVTSSEHMGHVVTCLGSGDEFGCSLSYKVQPEPRGIADALNKPCGATQELDTARLNASLRSFLYLVAQYTVSCPTYHNNPPVRYVPKKHTHKQDSIHNTSHV